MSFIVEALKQAEQARRSRTTDAQQSPDPTSVAPIRRYRSRVLVGTALVPATAAIALVGWQLAGGHLTTAVRPGVGLSRTDMRATEEHATLVASEPRSAVALASTSSVFEPATLQPVVKPTVMPSATAAGTAAQDATAAPATIAATAGVVRPSMPAPSAIVSRQSAVRFRPPTALDQPLGPPSPSPRLADAPLRKDRPAVPPFHPSGEAVDAPDEEVVPSTPRSVPHLDAIGDLPPELQAELRQLRVAVLFYAPVARQRMAMIDGRQMREGDDIGVGLRLDEITADGLIVAHEGLRVLARVGPDR